jgi:hypothetical protein
MSDHEHDSATEVGEAVDALLDGRDTGADDPAIVAARRIRASLHPPALSPERRTALAATVAGQWVWRRRRRTVTAALAIAAVLVLVILASLLFGRGDSLPVHLRSRETATLIPGPFPPEQSASDRIDLIYSDRLGSFRELRLRPDAPRRPRKGAPQRTASTIAEVSP